MCKSLAEGGQRCAAHTRGPAEEALRAMSQTPHGQPIILSDEQVDDLVAFASTPTGRAELRDMCMEAQIARNTEKDAFLYSIITKGDDLAEANREAEFAILKAQLDHNMWVREERTIVSDSEREKDLENNLTNATLTSSYIPVLDAGRSGEFFESLTDRQRAGLWERGDPHVRRQLMIGLVHEARTPLIGVRKIELSPKLRDAIVKNPDTQYLYPLSKKVKPPFTTEEVDTMLYCAKNPIAVANMLWHNDDYRAAAVQWAKDYPNRGGLLRQLSYSYLPAEEVRNLAVNGNAGQRAAVAVSPQLTEADKVALSLDDSPEVRLAVAGDHSEYGVYKDWYDIERTSYSLPLQAAKNLINDPNPAVGIAAFRNHTMYLDQVDDDGRGPEGYTLTDSSRELLAMATPQRRAELEAWFSGKMAYRTGWPESVSA